MATRRRRTVRAVVTVLVGALVLVSLGLVGARAFQSRLAFHPDRSTPAPAASAIPGASDVTIETSDGLRLAAWFVPPLPGAPARDQAVLYAPGNGGNRANRAGIVRELAARGFAVLLMEYRGFGGNPGTPSEAGLLRDASAAQRELVALGYPAERTIYFGESIGTGVVAGLQAQVPPAGILLRSPFTSLAAAAAHLVPVPGPALRLVLDRNRFPVEEQIAATQVPVTVVQGQEDSIVPPAQSDAVASAAMHLVEHLRFPHAGHNDAVMFGPPVADAVVRLGDAVR
jgi:fermentation-respiration switch protein FrsA (DUF1100 family)